MREEWKGNKKVYPIYIFTCKGCGKSLVPENQTEKNTKYILFGLQNLHTCFSRPYLSSGSNLI